MYKFDQSCPKPILSPQLIAQNKRHFLFIITTSLTILPTKLMTPHIEGSQQRYAQKIYELHKLYTNTKGNNNYLFSLIPNKQAIYCAV
jgi:hypothetical protein